MLKQGTDSLIKGIYKKTSSGLKFSFFGEVLNGTTTASIKLHSLPSAYDSLTDNYTNLVIIRSSDNTSSSNISVSTSLIGGQTSNTITAQRLNHMCMLPNYFNETKNFQSINMSNLTNTVALVSIIIQLDVQSMTDSDYVYVITNQIESKQEFRYFSKSDIENYFVLLGDNIYVLNTVHSISFDSSIDCALPYCALLRNSSSTLSNVSDVSFKYMDACLLFDSKTTT